MFWALVPVFLLAFAVTGLGIMATIATRDPGFALETNYYERAVHWDREQAQRVENARLGLRVALTVEPGPAGVELVATVHDRAGVPLPGANLSAEGFANARSGARRSLVFSEKSDGTYRAALAEPRPGLWELRLVVLSGGTRFTEVVRVDVPERSAP
jgi:nitrogen fixation protein FixH